MHNSFLARNPILFKFLSRFRKSINYEKLLYLRKIKKGHTVLDIGANQGYYTSLFSILTGNKGQVHAFEPVPESFNKLKKLRTSFSNVIINHCAIGKESGSAIISYDPNDSEKASILNVPKLNPNKSQTIVRTIDEYVSEKGLTEVNFIKCDVEGFELEVLIGAYQSLAKYKPAISMEMTLNEDETKQSIQLLKKAGYKKFLQVEKGFPCFKLQNHNFDSKDYFYLYATC